MVRGEGVKDNYILMDVGMLIFYVSLEVKTLPAAFPVANCFICRMPSQLISRINGVNICSRVAKPIPKVWFM